MTLTDIGNHLRIPIGSETTTAITDTVQATAPDQEQPLDTIAGERGGIEGAHDDRTNQAPAFMQSAIWAAQASPSYKDPLTSSGRPAVGKEDLG